MKRPTMEMIQNSLNNSFHRILLLTIVLLIILFTIRTHDLSVYANDEPIEIITSEITSFFPEGIHIKLTARSKNNINSAKLRFRIGQQSSSTYNYFCQSQEVLLPEKWRCDPLSITQQVNGEFFWRTNTRSRYIPPGTIITYNFEIEDSDGNLLTTKPKEFVLEDPRFKWQEVVGESIAVAYHGPVKFRAEAILGAMIETINTMGPVLGVSKSGPIRVTMYNNVKEMLEALPLKSSAVGRELITEGQAFSDIGTLLVLGGGTNARGTASHEITHILVHRAGNSIFGPVPVWLNEGLAEYGNTNPGFSYEVALEFAAATGRLMPVVFTKSMPGKPENIVIFYGQSRSIVRMMIRRFGADKMAQLMATLKKGKKIETAVDDIYDLTLLELDTMWRDSLGVDHYVPPESGLGRPTALPLPTIIPYSLTPQANKMTTSQNMNVEPFNTSETASDKKQESLPRKVFFSCGSPIEHRNKPIDVSTVMAVIGLAGLWYRKRPK